MATRKHTTDKTTATQQKRRPTAAEGPPHVAGARRAKIPAAVPPQLATLVATPPPGSAWFHEIKFDGYRLLAHVERGHVRLLTRRQLDWTARFPALAQAFSELPIQNAVFDGEVVSLAPSGVSSFAGLQTALSAKDTAGLVYYAFDLLYCNGFDLREAELRARKRLLAKVLANHSALTIRYSDHIVGNGAQCFREACRRGLEGIISKRSDRPYVSGRGGDWLKCKCIQREEFVIGGFTDPMKSRAGFGALLLGYFDRNGQLQYAGRVGTGFSARLLGELQRKLLRLERKTGAFSNLSRREAGRGVHWVAPQLVCQVEFTNWTRDGVLRHASFQGLRADLPARRVVRDAPVPGGLAEERPTRPVRNG